MSDVAVPMTGELQIPTWRDAITPSARSSRRRWTLAYALLLSFAGVYLGLDWPHGDGDGWLVTVGLFVVFGMLRRGTRRLTAIDHPGLDERDMLARDRAFRLAYPLMLVVLLATIAALAIVLPDATRTVVQADADVTSPGFFLGGEALVGLGLWLMLWGVFLPTGVLAWREPDVLEPDPGEPGSGLAEPARDALLGGALVAGLVMGLLTHNDAYALAPLVAVLMALGALARRAAGQPPVQAATLWRFAAAAALVVAILAALFVSVGGGS
jgi:hypothetical protein